MPRSLGETQAGFSEAGLSEHLCNAERARPISPKQILSNEDEGVPEAVDEATEEEEGNVKPVRRRAPHEPTNEEIEDHNINHLPYRNWCRKCVDGRGKNHPHKGCDQESRTVPTCHVDYWFMRDRKGAELVPVVTMKEDITKMIKAHVVPAKGDVEGAADMLINDMKRMGCMNEVIVKSDQEAALGDLVKTVQARRAGKTIIEKAAVKDSQSNGVAERAVQSIEGMVRTMKLALEERIGVPIPSTHAIMTWMVEHAAETLNRFLVGSDGRTPYERMKGKRYRGEVFEFGRRVRHRHPGKVEGGSMERRWSEGIWLGKSPDSDEHIVALDTGVIAKARAIVMMPESESWSKEKVMKICARSGVKNEGGKPGEVADGELAGDQVTTFDDIPSSTHIPDPVIHERAPQDVYIRKEDLQKFQYTKGCRKCDAIKSGDNNSRCKTRMSHNSTCRTRIREAMAKHEETKQRIRKKEEEESEFLARQVEETIEREKSAKAPRIEVAGEDEPKKTTEQSQSSSSSSGSGQQMETGRSQKRERDAQHDEEENSRPTGYQTIDEPEVPPARGMKRRGGDRDADGDDNMGDELMYMKESDSLRRDGRYSVAEVFSPPRVCARARERGMAGGWSMDWMERCPITGQAWDLSKRHIQEKAMKLLKRDKPGLLIASPPCTLFSLLQNLSGNPRTRDPEAWRTAVNLLEFAVKMCEEQRKNNRLFVFEHPLGATSWKEECLDKLRREEGVLQAIAHQCQFNQRAVDPMGNEGLVMKPTRFLTNSTAIQEKLARKCQGDHSHVQLVGGRAKAAAVYTEELVDAILDGYRIECTSRIFNLQDAMTALNIEGLHEEPEKEWYYIDDTTGEVLDMNMVRKARQEEMVTFEEMGVYIYVRRETAMKDSGGKIIGVRWVDVKKGAGVRSRLVAQEFNTGEVRDDLFAGTPPLAAMRYLISDVASCGRKGPGNRRLMVMDVKRAFLYGNIEESIYIELPEEDPKKKQGYVGKLIKAMYGTRAAPQVWQKVVRKVMTGMEFTASRKYPNIYYHKNRDLKVMTHVDDFLCSGAKDDLKWLEAELSKEFEIKSEVLGKDAGEKSEVKFLGRTIRRKEWGLEYEADEKHVEVLMSEWNMQDSKPVSTPGTAEEKQKGCAGDMEEKLDKKEAKEYRRAAARINYLAQDRADLAFAAKEVSRAMSDPNKGDVVRLKRVLRYLKGTPRIAIRYPWQDREQKITGFTDSDWAGCVKTRRSTSGGCIVVGKHLLHHWSSTQTTVALSSGEAELNALIKVTSELIGMVDLRQDCGEVSQVEVFTDSSAARGIAMRQGCGKLKHVETRQLWVQEIVASKYMRLEKVPRADNPADAFTHHWLAHEGDRHFGRLEMRSL